MNARRLATTTGAVGLVAGLALGANGLATAAGSATTPRPSGATLRPSQAPAAGPQDDRGPGPRHRPRGGPGGGEALVVSSTADSLVVRTPRGEQTVALTKTTTYFTAAGTKADSSILQAGKLVHVRLSDPRAAAPTAAEIRLAAAHLDGYVTKIDAGTFTVLDPGGFVRTINTTGATEFRKDGTKATAAAITVGSFVSASGTAVGADLQATRITTGRPDPADRPGDADRPARPGRPGGAPAAGQQG